MRVPLRIDGIRFAAILVLLAAMVPLTWGFRHLSLRTTRADIQSLKLEAISRAFGNIQGDLDETQFSLLQSARRLAEREEFVSGLSKWEPGSPPEEDLVRIVASMELPERVSIEVYSPTPQLVTWKGYSMPLDDGPSRAAFLDEVLTGVAQDTQQRTALVIWLPVGDGFKVVGAVRIMELLELSMPVENEYLRPYSQSRLWARRAGLPVRVVYDAPFDDVLPPHGEVRLLSGLDGNSLGRVFIDMPDDEELVGRMRHRYDQILAFWATLILGWIAAGAWMLYRRSADRAGPLLARFALFSAVWWTVRFLLIDLDVPARYQTERAPLSPLFDPIHLASSAGSGLLRSTGDLLISAAFALVFALATVNLAGRFRRSYLVTSDDSSGVNPFLERGTWIFGLVLAGVSVAMTALLGALSRVTILDSTLDYFARTGLLPERLVLVVFSGLLIWTVALVILGIGLAGFGARILARGRSVTRSRFVAGVLTAVLLASLTAAVPDAASGVPWYAVIVFGAAVVFGQAVMLVRLRDRVGLLTLRNVLPSIFVLTAILYPLFYRGMEVQRGIRMVDAAESFEDGRDPRVLYGVEHILEEAARAPTLLAVLERLTSGSRNGTDFVLDSLATALVRNSFVASLGSYDVSMTVYGLSGDPVGRYYEVDPRLSGAALTEIEQADLRLMRDMHSESGGAEPLVEPIMGTRLQEGFLYHGILPLEIPSGGGRAGWVLVRAEPRTLLREAATPFPRVLVPAGFYGNLHASLSVAVFRNGALVRSTGHDFGRYRLPDDVAQRLPAEREVWLKETVKGKEYEAYYRLQEESDPVYGAPSQSVIAVRIPSISIFDHLYNLLRLTFGGLIIGLPIYVGGLLARRRRGLLPAPRVRFRDKILNAFFGVGVITVAAMGVVGLNVVTGENEREVESWLRQHLERIERTIVLDARGGEMPYRVLERTRIDSLAARVGMDINLYKDNLLVASSRPQLVSDRLIDPRLPIGAYEALYIDGFRFAQTEERLGRFRYMAGFRAIPDEEGHPLYVLSVPTLPEQERLEEERARTVAYLFGALLLLVLVVMITAALLANALTRPIARLREGIEAVTRGRFSRIRPLETRDEIGELVDSFNTMQDQLSDSRRRLAQQERQLAWREMARQVAHEIKNPLTPMKLSVQHLRRSFEERRQSSGEQFTSLFDRITSTLTEQIDSLARIANEFSSFARMPQRIEESLDVNAVVAEAATLMEAEAPFEIDLDLEDAPLILRADREEVRRIYINLIKNAIQSIPEGRDGRITVSTRLQTDGAGSSRWVLSAVEDNGSGIPEELRSKIFVPNFSTKTSGTGLGLAIAKKSVEDLHGEIGFETALHRGTTFWVRLPLEPDGVTHPERRPP